MAAVEGSLEEEALKRRERLKAMRKKSGVSDEQVSEIINYRAFLSWGSIIGGFSQLQYLVEVEEDRREPGEFDSILKGYSNFSFLLIDRLPMKSITQEEKKDDWMIDQNPRKLSALYELKVSKEIDRRVI